jgi:hypothetical protein
LKRLLERTIYHHCPPGIPEDAASRSCGQKMALAGVALPAMTGTLLGGWMAARAKG